MPPDEHRAAVFISFSSADQPTAQLISDHLELAGIRTFFAPRDISGGMNFALEIVKAISSCDVVLVILSPEAADSPHVRREVTLAIDERRALLPVALAGTSYPIGFSTEWTYWLSAVQVMDYAGPDEILRRLRRLLPDGAPRRPTGTLVAQPKPAVSRRRKLSGRSSSPSAILRPDSTVPSLLGRETELVRLEQWCLRDDDFDVRIVTGGAGQGKSRLATELMRVIEAQAWQVRILPASAEGTETIIRLSSQPTLLVIDYAETRSAQLFDMFQALLDHGVHDRVRVLLLARTTADWWNSLLARDADVADLVADTATQPIKNLTWDRELVNQLFTTACAQFAAKIGVPPVQAVTAPYKAYDSVLDVLEDALVTVLGASPDVVSGTDRLLAHERRYLAASAQASGITEIDSVDLNRIAAALTLYGAASEDEAVQIIQECNRDLSPVVRRQLARLFRRLYPGARTYIVGLRPDALAEDLLAGILETEGRLPASAAGLNEPSRTARQRQRALVALARGAMRHPAIAGELERAVRDGDLDLLLSGIEVATQVEEPDRLSSAIANAIENRSAGELATLLNAVPDESFALAGLAAELAKKTLTELPDPAAQTLEHIITAIDCSNRFSDAGWTDEAAASAQIVVDRLRVVNGNGQVLRLLGRALSNLSNRLWELGRLTEALDPAVEATRRLDEADAPPVERAAARSNLAFRLSELGRQEEALTEALEAERLCAGLDADSHPGFAKTRGSVLNNLTCIFLAAGEAIPASEHGQACVDLRRSQALLNRDRFLPFVARALANAAPAAEATGQSDLADRMLVEARSLHRITGLRAPIFRFEEAESATVASIILLGRQQWEAATAAAVEAHVILATLDVDLRDLSARLNRTLFAVRAAAAACEVVSFSDIAMGQYPSIQQPRLLEYRDL